jgi:protein-S-isoprenylcysteine O-methyltransferase Ste14
MIAIPVAAWIESMRDIVETPELRVLRFVGAVVVLGALLLIAAASTLLRRARAFTAFPRPLESGSLVEAGPYRIIRHPVYAGIILAGIGAAIIRASPAVALLTLALFLVLDVKRRREEAWLSERYPAYGSYRARTKAFVPLLY